MRGTALCAAIEARNCDIARYLIEAGCDVNASDYDGEPPLLLALRKEKPLAICLKSAALDIAKILIFNKKCDLNKIDPLTKKSAIHFATEQGMEEVVDWLLSANCNLNQTDANGNMALHLAVHNGYFDIAKKLTNDPRCLVKAYNNAGLVPIHIPCNNGNLKCLQTIIECLKMKQRGSINRQNIDSELFVNVNAETKFEKDTCLHLAARNFYTDITRELIQHGASTNSKNNLGQQALVLACSANEHWAKKDNSVPEILLKAGANPNIKGCVRNRYLLRDTEITPLIVAAKTNNLEFAKMLVGNGADVNLSDNLGQTPIYHALWGNSKEVARFLLMDCPEINANFKDHEDKNCFSAVLKCKKNYTGELAELVKAIFRAGGELHNNSPLLEAVSYENVEVLDAILEETDINPEEVMVDKDEGFNLLHTCIGMGNIDLARVLLSHGDNIDRLTNLGESPFRVALNSEMIEAAEFLLSNGCDLYQDEWTMKLLQRRPVVLENVLGQKARDSEDSDSDNSESDDDDDFNEIDDMLNYFPELLQRMHECVTSARRLDLLCLMLIRKYFRAHSISFRKVMDLPLAEPLKLAIRYKNT